MSHFEEVRCGLTRPTGAESANERRKKSGSTPKNSDKMENQTNKQTNKKETAQLARAADHLDVLVPPSTIVDSSGCSSEKRWRHGSSNGSRRSASRLEDASHQTDAADRDSSLLSLFHLISHSILLGNFFSPFRGPTRRPKSEEAKKRSFF